MFSNHKFAGMALVFALAIAHAPGAYAQKHLVNFVNDDDVFQALRDAARRDDPAKALELASRLAQYPVPSYV